MTEKTGIRVCTDKKTRLRARMLAAKLGIELNEVIRFLLEYFEKHGNFSDFEKKVAQLKRKYDRKAKKA